MVYTFFMAVKKGKTRIIFTCSESQARWLKNVADSRNISVSKLIRFSLIHLSKFARDVSNLNGEDIELLHFIASINFYDDFDD